MKFICIPPKVFNNISQKSLFLCFLGHFGRNRQKKIPAKRFDSWENLATFVSKYIKNAQHREHR